jgi:hypothetical protein
MPTAIAERRAELTPGTHRAPREAFQFRAPIEFTFAEGDSNLTTAPVKMLARTAQPIDHWYWGKCVHDMDGVTFKDRIPLDWCHWYDLNVGYASEITADKKTGLTVGGLIVSTRDDDMAAEILARGRAGVPYEASIDFHGPKRIEIVPEGSTAKVNGYSIDGPVVIFREWPLKAVAVCPFGADGGTSTKFSRDGHRASEEPADVEVTLFSEPESMAKEADKKNKPTDAPADDGQLSETQQAPPAAHTEAAAAAAAAFKATLAQFVAEFGAVHGSQWAAEGKTHEEALKLHADGLAAQLKATGEAKDAEIEALKTKLAAVDKGETDALSFSDGGGATDAAKTQLVSKIGSNLAAFASSIKMPERAGKA